MVVVAVLVLVLLVVVPKGAIPRSRVGWLIINSMKARNYLTEALCAINAQLRLFVNRTKANICFPPLIENQH